MALHPAQSPLARAAALMLLIGSVSVAQATEADLKAAYLFNFIKFADWPEAALSATSEVIVVAVFGDDNFGDALKVLDGKTAKNRRVELRRHVTLGGLDGCHVLFIPTGEKDSTRKIIQALKGRSVLTVSEYDGFTRDGGMIGFYIDGRKVKFEVNIDEAAKVSVKIGSQVLGLARIVRNEKPASRPAPDDKPARPGNGGERTPIPGPPPESRPSGREGGRTNGEGT